MRVSGLRIAYIGASLVVILLMHAIGFLLPLENSLRSLFLPIERVGSFVGHAWHDRFPDQTSVPELQARVRDLEAHLAAMSVDDVKLQAVEAENKALHQTCPAAI